ncbi:MAG: hypothetical protein JWQ18_3736, partial [Conexibacter sp.]|nr:hypothetical protein [Conexibacter sp.]
MSRYVAAADAAGATIPQVLRERAALSPEARAVVCGAESVDYATLLARAEQAAAALSFAGVRAGDKVAVMLPNGLPFLALWLGTALLGAVLVPINTGLVRDGLRHVVEHSDSVLVVADEAGAAALGAMGPARRR